MAQCQIAALWRVKEAGTMTMFLQTQPENKRRKRKQKERGMEEEGEGEGEGVDCQWKVRAASSEASAQSAHNILKQELYRIWQTREATDESWLLLEPEFPVAFKSVEIVNAGTSLLEIYGLRAEGARDEFELLLPAQQLMSVKDLMSKSNRNRSFTYSVPHKLAAIAAEYKWKELKIVCRQPFRSADQSSCIGLSKLQVICCKTKSEISKAFAESLLETHMEARILEMFPSTSSVKVSPEGRKFESSIHSQHQANSLAGSTISDLEVATPKKRRLPGWAFCNHNVNSQALDAKEDYLQKSSFPAKSADDSTERLVLEKGKGAFKKTEKKQEGSSLQRTNQIAQESITPKEIMRSFEVEERPKDDANKNKVRIKAEKSISSDNISDEKAKKKGKEKGSEPRSLSKSGRSDGEPSPGNKGVTTIKRGFQVGQYLRSSQEKLEADNTKQVQENLDVFPLSPSDSNGIRDSIGHATSSWVISNNKDLKASANSAVHDSLPKVGSTTFSQAGKQASRPLSKLLEGVVFAISGVVNPERAELRKKALEMGASYQPDWNDECTLLLTAFVNTPKFKQVMAQSGTIVSKDWISECYRRRELVDIGNYLLFYGNPWRKGTLGDATDTGVEDDETWIPPGQILETRQSTLTHENREDTGSKVLGTSTRELGIGNFSLHTKGEQSNNHSQVGDADDFIVQQWAHEDLQAIMKWLQQQQYKPDSKQLESIARQGLMTCLEDAIKSIKANTGVSDILESWAFVPRAIKELQCCEEGKLGTGKHSTQKLLKKAERVHQIYDLALREASRKPFDEKGELEGEERRNLSSDDDKRDDDDATEIITDDSRDDLDSDDESTVIMNDDEVRHAKTSIINTYRASMAGF